MNDDYLLLSLDANCLFNIVIVISDVYLESKNLHFKIAI